MGLCLGVQVCNLIYVFDTDSFKWKKYKNVLSDPSAPRTKKSGPDRTLVDSPKLPGGDVTGQVPMARDGHSACVIDDSMYIYGGYVESAHQVSRALSNNFDLSEQVIFFFLGAYMKICIKLFPHLEYFWEPKIFGPYGTFLTFPMAPFLR